jgi:hypothetical protein
MRERERILERIEKLNEAVAKARAYLANGDYSDWHGFRPLFSNSKERPPHPDWVANVFLPHTLATLEQCTRVLETLERKEKELRTSRQRKRSR